MVLGNQAHVAIMNFKLPVPDVKYNLNVLQLKQKIEKIPPKDPSFIKFR